GALPDIAHVAGNAGGGSAGGAVAGAAGRVQPRAGVDAGHQPGLLRHAARIRSAAEIDDAPGAFARAPVGGSVGQIDHRVGKAAVDRAVEPVIGCDEDVLRVGRIDAQVADVLRGAGV